jgi:KaiC/GvpD/RAD55 family RecA-like ATPase
MADNSIFDDVPLMDAQAQELYVNSILSSPELFGTVQHIIEAKYFDENLQPVVGFIKEYFQRHKSIPSKEIVRVAGKFSAKEVEVIGRDDIEFMSNQIANFCKFRAVIATVMTAPQLIKENDLGKLIKELTTATQISLHTDLGIDYFEDVEARICLTAETDIVIPTGWDTVDQDVIGVGRQELILFLAPSGGGKSVGMTNFAMNLCKQGMNGVYITLEMRDKLVARRFDSMIATISGREIYNNLQRVVDEVNLFHDNHKCKFYVKRMRENTTTANDVSAYVTDLQRRTGIKVDFIVVDYIDIMKPVEKVDSGNMFSKDKVVTEEVRALGMDFNAIMISASQLGRDAWEVIRNGGALGQDHIQGGMSKINTSDLAIAIVKDEAMDAAGMIEFQYLKTRNSGGVGKRRKMAWNTISLRISDLDEQKLVKNSVEVIQRKAGTVVAKPVPSFTLQRKNNGTN